MPVRRSHERRAMLDPPQVAALLIAAIVAVYSFHAGPGQAIADPLAASREAPEATPRMSLAAPAADGSSTTPAVSARSAAPVAQPPAANRPDLKPPGRAYLFRGFLAEILSPGM